MNTRHTNRQSEKARLVFFGTYITAKIIPELKKVIYIGIYNDKGLERFLKKKCLLLQSFLRTPIYQSLYQIIRLNYIIY